MNVILHTRRLLLREMTDDDLDFVAEMLADAQVMRHYPQTYERDEAQRWLRRQQQRYTDEGYGLWLAVLQATGQSIGQVGLTRQTVDGVPQPEIGYLVHRPYWRKGYAREAAAATRNWAFSQRGLEQVISLVRPVNIPSQRVALSIGMKPQRLTMYAGLEHLVFAVQRGACPSDG